MRRISAATQFTGAPKPLNRPCTITQCLERFKRFVLVFERLFRCYSPFSHGCPRTKLLGRFTAIDEVGRTRDK
jgi:hypothetical protein